MRQAVQLDLVIDLLARVIRRETPVIWRMPILRRDDQIKVRLDPVHDRNDLISVPHREGAARKKVVLDIYNDDGTYRATQAMFWLYYPEIRDMLAQYEVYNPENDVARMTWDDYFEGRYFASRIIKTSNPFDLTFQQRGMSNMEALYEAEKAQEMLFNKEHDMWVY